MPPGCASPEEAIRLACSMAEYVWKANERERDRPNRPAFLTIPATGIAEMLSSLQSDSPQEEVNPFTILASGGPSPFTALHHHHHHHHHRHHMNRPIEEEKEENEVPEEQQREAEEQLAKVYDKFDFHDLWARLSEALSRLQNDPASVQVLLPMIEVSGAY